MPIAINVVIGNRTFPVYMEQSDVVKNVKDMIHRQTGINTATATLILLHYGPLSDHQLINSVCKGGEQLYLEGLDDHFQPSPATKKPTGTAWNFESNVSLDKSTQVNGFVGDTQPPLLCTGGTPHFTKNESRGASIQINGFISNMDIFNRGGAS